MILLANRGLYLARETRKAMALVEELALDDSRLPAGLADNSLGEEILVWFRAMSTERHALPLSIQEERGSYYRALFNLSTDRRTRVRLTEDLRAMDAVIPMMEDADNIGSDEEASTLVAAVANLVYEDATKVLLMREFNVPPIFTKLLRSTANTVATHTARGIFSMTTVYEFKKKFAVEPGLLPALIACLSRESKQLSMNAAGAIANIAIHPESKVPIVQLGALVPLMMLGNTDDDEGVLHQVSRCIFSLAAERTNRTVMCEKGILNVISRLLGFQTHQDILANAIGCFGNLAMTEVGAQEQSIPTVLRMLPLLAASDHQTLDRQATRVLFSFSYRDQVKTALVHEDNLPVLIRKLSSLDSHVVRDVAGIISNIVCGDAAVKERFCELGGFQRIVSLFERFNSGTDVLGPVTRSLYALVNCSQAKEYLCKEAPAALKTLVNLAGDATCASSRHALGALANIACDDMYSKDLLQCGVLSQAIQALFQNPRAEARKQAGRLLYNLTRRHGTALSYLAQFGGPDGEDKRLIRDLRLLFANTFAVMPRNVLGDNAGPSNSKLLYLNSVVTDNNQVGTAFVTSVFEPLVLARCPLLIEKLSDKNNTEAPESSLQCWQLLFEFVYTNTLSITAQDLAQNDTLYRDISLLSEVFGLKRLVDEVLAMMTSSQHMDLAASSHPTTSSLSSPREKPSSNTAIFAFSFLPDADVVLFSSATSSSSFAAASSASSTVSTGGGDEEATCHRDDPDVGTPRLDFFSMRNGSSTHLRKDWQWSMNAMLSGGVNNKTIPSDVTVSVTLDANERLSPKAPLTRARKAAMLMTSPALTSPFDKDVVTFSDFIQEMIDEWMIAPGSPPTPVVVKLARGQRKRPHSASSAGDQEEDNRRVISFRAHKAVLGARSMYFKTLFLGSFQDRHQDTIEFRGPVDALVVMLRFLYCGMDHRMTKALSTDRDLCWRVLFMAHEYAIDGLQFHCERVIIETMMRDMDQVVSVCNTVLNVNVPFVKLACAEYVYIHRKKSTSSQAKAVLEATGLSPLFSATTTTTSRA